MTALLGLTIPDAQAGQRLDVVLAGLLPDYSRSRLQEWVRQDRVRLDGRVVASRYRVVGGEQVTISVPASVGAVDALPEDIPLDVVYEDEHLLVIDKTAGLVMHPAAGNWSGTVLNGLLFRYPELAAIPRAGIVHRLDKGTSGLFVVARTLTAHTSLVQQLQARSMGREYTAVVQGELVSGGRVDAPVGRHPSDRKRMAVNRAGKDAVTHYRLAEKFHAHTAITCKLETGRTHQIRVHMASIRHPLIGDATYGRRCFPQGRNEAAKQLIHDFSRQALHAHRLTLSHPVSGQQQIRESPLPRDIMALMQALRQINDDTL